MKRSIPRDPWPDSSLALLREGYRFLPGRFARLRSDVFAMRLLGKPAIALHGAHWARLFYDTERFTRRGVMPQPIQRTLVGTDGVQMQNGQAHRRRKAMFMALMGPDSIDALLTECERGWGQAAGRWTEEGGCINLMDEMQTLLCGAVCRWLGIRLTEGDAEEKGRWMGQMVDGFGSAGWRHLKGRRARKKAEAWARGIMRDYRLGHQINGRAAQVAFQQDEDGRLLDETVAAVDLLNLIRPVVAIATYIGFIGHALQAHPDVRRRLADGDAQYRRWFVQEVRRYYPFTPFVGARVRHDFTHDGVRFPKGRLVILDIYGLSRDPAIWEEPGSFRPERFAEWNENAYDFIPQGGGDHYRNHRCAGEWITIAVMEQATDWLATRLRYAVPEQDLSIRLTRIPTRPASGVAIENVSYAPRQLQEGRFEQAA